MATVFYDEEDGSEFETDLVDQERLDKIKSSVDLLMEMDVIAQGYSCVIDAGEIYYVDEDGNILANFDNMEALVAMAYLSGAFSAESA